MNGNSAVRSMLASSMAPLAVFACCTSFSSSPAMLRCFSNGCASGDSRIGSMGSSGLIRWARMQTFGSATSTTLSGPVGPAAAIAASAVVGERSAGVPLAFVLLLLLEALAAVALVEMLLLSVGSSVLGGGSCMDLFLQFILIHRNYHFFILLVCI